MPLQLFVAQPRTAASLLLEPPCTSTRCSSCLSVWRSQKTGTFRRMELGLASRRQVLPRAEYSRDPLGGSGGSGPSGRGPGTSFPQQPWTENYQYPPQQTAAQPPRLPPTNGSNGSGPGGDGGGGLSNLTKAFIAGAFILGEGLALEAAFRAPLHPRPRHRCRFLREHHAHACSPHSLALLPGRPPLLQAWARASGLTAR